jgi:hypothetical protein
VAARSSPAQYPSIDSESKLNSYITWNYVRLSFRSYTNNTMCCTGNWVIMGDWFDALAESISGLAQTEFLVEDVNPTFRWDSSHAYNMRLSRKLVWRSAEDDRGSRTI